MSKYIIEIDDDLPFNPQFLQVVGAEPNGTVRIRHIEFYELEELNSDYINEHYGSLQDEAYQRGLEDGKKATFGLVADASNAEYQKGFKDGKAVHEKGCEGCEFESRTNPDAPCLYCSNNFKNLWRSKKPIDDKIEVGDEVERYIINGKKLDSKGIYLGDTDEEGDYWNCLFWTGTVFTTLAYPKRQFKRTGRHFDIDKILEEMRK